MSAVRADEPVWLHVADALLAEILGPGRAEGDSPFYDRPWWHAEAGCRGRMVDGHSPWFTNEPTLMAEAEAICNGCAVRAECHTAGEHEGWGRWG